MALEIDRRAFLRSSLALAALISLTRLTQGISQRANANQLQIEDESPDAIGYWLLQTGQSVIDTETFAWLSTLLNGEYKAFLPMVAH